ncbi:MAG: hypothetical protein GXO76_00650 [Calditrichaeota bacterium]|nr:hypothetical protein [Calditrichota bacterium]
MHHHPPKKDIKDIWIPTALVGEKLWQFLDETFVNRPKPELNDRALYEVLPEEDGEPRIREYLGSFPPRPGKTVEDVLNDARITAGDFKYHEAYEKSGGLLNILLPRPNELYDEKWQSLLETYYVTLSFSSVQKKEERLRQLGMIWNDTPNEIFSMLTPAQVWAGGGLRESDLLTRFFEEITYRFSKKIKTEGEAILRSLLYLRSWQSVPLMEYQFQTAFTVIRDEREEIRRKKEALIGYRRPVITFHILDQMDPVAEQIVGVLDPLYDAPFVESALKNWVQIKPKTASKETTRALAGAVALITGKQLNRAVTAEHFAEIFDAAPEEIEAISEKYGTKFNKNR